LIGARGTLVRFLAQPLHKSDEYLVRLIKRRHVAAGKNLGFMFGGQTG